MIGKKKIKDTVYSLTDAARKAVWGCRTAIRNFRKRHTPDIVKEYRALAAKKGSRLARQELLGRMKEKLLRPLRKMTVKRQMKKGGEAPLVSFILPVYNVEPYLRQAMDCLLEQSLRHIEIICVDDGSTDNSLEILRWYEQKDSRVRVFTQKNQFAGVARNLGLSKATGEYVCFLDPDDFFERTLAEDTYFTAKVDRADIVVFSAMYYDNTEQTFREAPELFQKKYVPKKRVFNRADCPDYLYMMTSPCTWNKLFRRQFVLDEKLLFQDIHNSNDLYFTFCALAMAERIVVLDKVLTYYRIGVQTSLQATKDAHPLCTYEACKALHNTLKERGLLEQVRRSFVNTALPCCTSLWRKQTDPEKKQQMARFLTETAFPELEVTGHERRYYIHKWCYHEMQVILGNETLRS